MKYLILTLALILSCSTKHQQPKPSPEAEFTCIQYQTFFDDANCKVFGYSDTISEAGLIYEWRLKKRLTPEWLMLVKAKLESGNSPFMYRLEKRINMISSGLFQQLGPDAIEYSIQEQMQAYDSLMNWCLIKSGGNIAKAVFYYNTPYGVYRGNEWWVVKTMKYYYGTSLSGQ
jgi:hypothetical protein